MQTIRLRVNEKVYKNLIRLLSKFSKEEIQVIEELTEQISINPRQFPIVHLKLNVCKCVITKHNSLFYRNKRSHVELLRIYDNRQDPSRLKFE
jgi:hypothetical protein